MMDAMFIGSMHGVADSCSLNGGFRLDVANTRLSEFPVPLLPITQPRRLGQSIRSGNYLTYSQPKKEITGLRESRLLGLIAASLV
jgi:hypothetical protein